MAYEYDKDPEWRWQHWCTLLAKRMHSGSRDDAKGIAIIRVNRLLDPRPTSKLPGVSTIGTLDEEAWTKWSLRFFFF